ncbi:hypothetical protein L7F22_063825 [Adiantum nelumboides]|nr:hypothetical protein [Adiantum nelumboides]
MVNKQLSMDDDLISFEMAGNVDKRGSLEIYCFNPEEQKLSHAINTENKGFSIRKSHARLSWTKEHHSMSRRIVELAKKRQLDMALDILNNAIQSNYMPNRVVMNAALQACVHCGDLSRAQIIFDSMLDPGYCGVDVISYAILIKGFGNEEMLDEAYEVVEALESGTAPGGPTLTEVHLHTLLNALAEAADFDGKLPTLAGCSIQEYDTRYFTFVP